MRKFKNFIKSLLVAIGVLSSFVTILWALFSTSLTPLISKCPYLSRHNQIGCNISNLKYITGLEFQVSGKNHEIGLIPKRLGVHIPVRIPAS